MLMDQKVQVGPQAAGRRLDRFLRERFPGVPARSVRFALESGAVRVGAEIGVKGRSLRQGETVTVAAIAESDDWLPVPGDLPGASIAYEDLHVVVLCKPCDVHTEPQRPNEPGTLAGFLRRCYPRVAEFSAVPGLSLLTRLDYATSGVIPAALTPAAFVYLQKEREMGRIEKRYLCLVEGELASAFSIAWSIDDEGGHTVRVRRDRPDADPNRWTHLDPVRSQGGTTLLRATISRGKRHQIRAHLAAAGHPIVGDRRYGSVPAAGPGRNRLMLHSERVTFRHPENGEPLSVACAVPEDFGITSPEG
jgi:23S rRNA pseudouridine1911/1915/1917 synthase